MSFPLGSLLGGDEAASEPAASARPARRQSLKREAPPPSATSRLLRTPLWLALMALLLALLVLAMATHDLRDAAFSTSGQRDLVANRVGSFGAWVSDSLLFLFGFSAWWLPVLALRGWLRMLAGVLRHDVPAVPRWSQRARAWAGVLLLIGASCALEWSRLYAVEARLPGHAGGIVGYTLGPLGMKGLGFAGSGVVWIVLLLTGMAWALRFSWGHLAERIGERIEQLREKRIEKREIKADQRAGEQAVKEREHEVEVERQIERQWEQGGAEHAPLVIEAPVVEVPQSTR
ncbi:MAG: DNA translocase FtsK, partial [Rubrivivax sp.]